MSKDAVIILGMHRSGTSWLTGSLQQAGLYLAKHHSWNPHNRKGNRENPDVMALHEDILAANNGAWDTPPRQPEWSDQHLNMARALIESNAGKQRWGFKDPRTLLVLAGWRSLLDSIEFVGIFRHPVAVAESLHARGGMTRTHAFQLWEAYNSKLLAEYRQSPFPVLCFDWTEQELEKALVNVCRQLKLSRPVHLHHEQAFFDSGLRHNHVTDSDDVPKPLVELYFELSDIAMQAP
ncbi:MAG: sulfotransferase family protein [Gammaproteobacteria bacterium]|nr:sulfotransferase family protein [Gammaproteobacteria bacterium]